ncbi:hypothetical protein E8E11_009764 [Didymella keratinophila]|nr:hypothetical protein E8E11_009764 [Didymella keratinophila]
MSEHQKEIEEFGNNDDFWLFGYGSLIWKPPPHFGINNAPSIIMISECPATSRATFDASGRYDNLLKRMKAPTNEDHRGTPEAPGRVATLIDRAHWDTLSDHHEPTERVWGAAYHIPATKVPEVREYLDIREINGYSIQFTPFHPASEPASASKPIKCLVYIGLPSNPQFLGPQDPEVLAAHILKSSGPSGENKEYLFNLEEALLGLSEESGDWHVSDLVERCRRIEAEEGV